ncbi:S-adenosyl-L-methionine-dependent methyltransferase [Xylaria digitata]|nr:S-adenosyl-L-methionine-dependent methyltransferase [Xylaria digitata]
MATTSCESSASNPRQTTPATAAGDTTTSSDSPQVGTTTTATAAATAAATTTATTTATATAQPTTSEATTISTTSTPALVSAEATTESAATPVATALEDTAQTDVLPASHWAQVPAEEEDDFDDVDSAYGDDNASSTASLSASILEYRTVHGRTYHSERGNAQSWNPNDAQHDESMDILHHVSTLMQDGKITMAHIDDSVRKVLDVGCGTGIWAIDFADQYPHAEVIGVDISPSQPQWIPPNLKFEIDDITLPWTYEPNSFDYIHMRWLIGAIPNWYTLFREAFQTLKPGGIFESKESSAVIQSDDGTVPYGSALDQWGRVFSEAGKKFGRTFRPVEEDIQVKAMQAAGFVDLKVYNMKTTLGPWPADPKHKEIGQYARLALEQDVEGFIMYMWTTVLGWTREEITVYAAHLRRELRSPNFHAYYPQRVVVGRKP